MSDAWHVGLFAAGALLSAGGAVGVVLARSPIHSVLGMLTNFLGLAVLYLNLNAEFLAAIQLIIYAGAVMVLFLFVVALLTSGTKAASLPPDRLRRQRRLGVALGVAFAAAITAGLLPRLPDASVQRLAAGFGTAQHFGRELLTTHVFAFELTALVLMIAVIGVVMLVGRGQPAAGSQDRTDEEGD